MTARQFLWDCMLVMLVLLMLSIAFAQGMSYGYTRGCYDTQQQIIKALQGQSQFRVIPLNPPREDIET